MTKLQAFKIIFFSSLIIFGSFTMHLLSIYFGVFLAQLNNTIGKVLTLCGINGIYVTEKPLYMPLIYIFIFILLTWSLVCLTFFIKSLIEGIAFNKRRIR